MIIITGEYLFNTVIGAVGRKGGLIGGVFQDVVRMLVMNRQGAGSHSSFRSGIDGVFFVFHPDEADRPVRSDGILRYHNRDVVTVDAYPFCQQHPVGHVLMQGIC
ncbi:hypothetical protein SDC9_113789 [bioreactor metagenome]|uniref:Uncharacterized protein n=1 Tax=bioreactor metagenome TaxID=1076179 RepID=A0A645BNQ8_9ZZZZ